MKPIVATTTEGDATVAGMALIEAGGNAVDAAVAAALAWPPSLLSGGTFVANGAGLGRAACHFAARVPGFGLSRPRRLSLLSGRAPLSAVGAACTAQALAAVLGRWGTVSLTTAARAAIKAYPKESPAPHAVALEMMADEGVSAFSRGTFGTEAARVLGPIEDGLLTRRDLIEARAEIGQASGPFGGLWTPWPLEEGRRGIAGPSERNDSAGEDVNCSIVVLDRRGTVAAIALDAGRRGEAMGVTVFGVPANRLLRTVPISRAKKVGQEIPLRRAAVVGGDTEQIGIAGEVGEIIELLGAGAEALDAIPNEVGGLLMVRRVAGGQLQIRGARSIESP